MIDGSAALPAVSRIRVDEATGMWRSVVTGSALIAVGALIVLLAWQNRGLRADRDWLTDRVNYAYPGMYVPVVDTVGLDGAKYQLGVPAGDRQILFFFNHVCPYCRASAPTVVETAHALRKEFGDRVDFIGVCDCEEAQAKAFVASHKFDFPVVAMSETRSLAIYRARSVPTLLAIDRNGRVRHTVQGVFNTRKQASELVAELRRKDPPPKRQTGK